MLRQLIAAALLSLALTPSAFGFDSEQCDVYVFRTQENALWHCGAKLPNSELYCDHSLGDVNSYPFAWASNHPDDWCEFMIATVRNEDHFPLTPQVGFYETPGPNVWFLSTLVDWGCYMVKDGGVEAYIVEPWKGHASSVTKQCERTMNYFDYWNLHPDIRDTRWWGEFPPEIHPTRMEWNRCHYDDVRIAPNYAPNLGVQFAECPAGYVCEQKFLDFAMCFPDPKADHECCISWHNKCQHKGECCLGSECNDDGYCEQGLEPVHENPPGICNERQEKEDRMLWNRCLNPGGQGDCADGYLCEGDWWYAYCTIDDSVKNECCKYNYDSSNPRPGDCCVGWRSHCHWYDESGKCVSSQCIPGREIGVAENGVSMLDVHDRLCHEEDVPVELSYNEVLGKCVGAICGAWGDPHIITCDNLHYDCQAVGLFTIMKNHMFNIQANFVFIPTDWGGASITNDLAIDYIKDPPNGVPTIQFSFPDFTQVDQNNQVYDERTRVIGNCPVMFYVDGEMVDISDVPSEGYLYGSSSADHSVKLTGWNQIDVNHKVGVNAEGESVYSTTVVWIEGGGPFLEWSCILTYFICLPGEDEERFRASSVGLLGTPTGSTLDDWMGPDGQTLIIPDVNRHQASFDYCLENWCVDQDSSLLVYEEGLTYDDYKCDNQEFFEFDVNECEKADEIIEACKDQHQVIACQMEKCAGHEDVDKEIEIIEEIITVGDETTENLIEFPDVEEDKDAYGDCANLGAGLSAATGEGAYTDNFPPINSINSETGGFTMGNDKSLSVLVGGDFRCIHGAGIEGRTVIIGDMTLEEEGCESLVATHFGSLIHPFDHTVCIEVGGDVSIDASRSNSKYVMYEYGNENKGCHFVYGGDGCEINGAECPTNMTMLEHEHVVTKGDFKQNPDLDLSRWEEELVLLKQKTNYWKSLNPNGVAEVEDGGLLFGSGPDNNPVQIFSIEPIELSTNHVVFKKGMIGKTIMIIVSGGGLFNVPVMCFEPDDHIPGEQPICGVNSFPTSLTGSIVWVFPAKAEVHMVGEAELMGSIVKPKGDLVFSTTGHSGRMIVGGDLTIDGMVTELHNYEYRPVSHPLPLGDDLGKICEVQPAPPCNETAYKILTSEQACPSKPEGVVNLIKKSADAPEGEPILYGIIIEPPKDGAHTVKFQVDNPFTNYTDIYVKHSKKVGKYGMDPVCEAMPFTAGCEPEAPLIEVSCHEYDGVDPFALVSIYFASNEDAFVLENAVPGTEIDKCCHPPSEYMEGKYGIIKYTFEIQCTCPETAIA